MSLSVFARRAAVSSSTAVSRPALAGFVRYNSSTSTPPPAQEEPAASTPSPSQEPQQQLQKPIDLDSINASQLLTALSSKSSSAKAADEEAQEWLSAIRDLRKDFTQNGTATFNPSRAFSADTDSDAEVNLVQQAMDTATREASKVKATEEQLAQYNHLKGLEIPARTDETIQYLTNVIMRHGRKARAQRVMSEALYLVHLNTRRDPIQLLKNTLENMAPILKLRRFTDGGARAEMVPVALTERQRTRHAWTWIVEASDKRNSKSFSVRLANEIIAASNGSGAGFAKKEQLHKSGIAARSFIKKL